MTSFWERLEDSAEAAGIAGIPRGALGMTPVSGEVRKFGRGRSGRLRAENGGPDRETFDKLRAGSGASALVVVQSSSTAGSFDCAQDDKILGSSH
jgi:hypothetical protein